MQRDPFTEEFLEAYLEASYRYSDAVDDLIALEGQGHPRFVEHATRTRELARRVEETRDAMMKDRATRA